ncbi:hypothetical protein [Aeromonas salmonicida]|uniref:hypothetical protein n=1 Tax=Aeromonas salmonicida TaxID=645 RepID=UPI0038BAA390
MTAACFASLTIEKPQYAKKAKQAADLAICVKAVVNDFPPYQVEYRFHPSRKWRFDYSWPDRKIALEVHGGVHVGGRHTRGSGFVKDREKMNSAQLLGWVVLEVTPEHIKSGQLRAWLLSAFNQDQDQRTNP